MSMVTFWLLVGIGRKNEGRKREVRMVGATFL